MSTRRETKEWIVCDNPKCEYETRIEEIDINMWRELHDFAVTRWNGVPGRPKVRQVDVDLCSDICVIEFVSTQLALIGESS